MTGSLITLIAISFLLYMIVNILLWVPVWTICYLFIKRARLYCRVKKELKCVLNERDIALKQISQK